MEERLITNDKWSNRKKFSFLFVFLFIVLFSISFSFPRSILPDIGFYINSFFEKVVKWFGVNVLRIRDPFTSALISDSTGMYISVLVIFIISIVSSLVITILNKSRDNYNTLNYWFKAYVRYYLALQLLTYGFNKVFKTQFFLPEPNTLFTTVGRTPADLLFWSTMGVSRAYSVFSGILEVFAALLLLFKRTTLIGASMSFAVLLNVALINFSYDISVKVYSLFLLLLAVVLIAPHHHKLKLLFINAKDEYSNKKYYKWKPLIKALIIILILVDVLFVYVQSNNFNDDKQQRPFLYGAYDIKRFIRNGDTIPPLLTDSTRWRRVFIHSKGYFITQKMNDEMNDFELEVDTMNKKLFIISPVDTVESSFEYDLSNNNLHALRGIFNNDTIQLDLQQIDLEKLPALQKEFNWTID